jgi:hypothetical protein
MTVARARARLERAGLRVQVLGGDDGVVRSQSPRARVAAAPGMTVTLRADRG